MTEFELIRRYFTRATPGADLGVGDDCALLSVSPGHQLAVSTDMLVSGRHFFADAAPRKLGHKALAVNLSDMAAMGARPRWFTLSLSLPAIDEAWLGEFATGLFALADRFDVDLVGGDTTGGPLNLCIQIMGEVPYGQALTRAGACAGDDIWVSGSVGDAALALAALKGEVVLPVAQLDACRARLECPLPRVELGQALRAHASAAIDVSDGLLADMGHILDRSSVGARVFWESLPRSAALRALGITSFTRRCALAGGDDYELCFTSPPRERAYLESLCQTPGIALSRIGVITAASGLIVEDDQGQPVMTDQYGFDHFA